MASKLITAPAVEPVTSAEMLTKIGLQSGDVASGDLAMIITAARRWCEEYTERAFITQTWEIRLDAFPAAFAAVRPPLQSVTSLQYIDTDGTLQTLAAENYALDVWRMPGWVLPAYDVTWPDTRAVANAVRLQIVCGYGSAGSDVPEPIRHAIVLIAGMSLRGQSGQEGSLYPAMIPNAAKELLQPYRLMGL